MKAALLTAVALAAFAPFHAAAIDCAGADRMLHFNPLQSWNDSYTHFVIFHAHCPGAALSHALSAQHTRLLDDTLPSLSGLREVIARDPVYLRWLLLGVFYNPQDLHLGAASTSCRLVQKLKSCSPADQKLCAKLAARVGPSPEHWRACRVSGPA